MPLFHFNSRTGDRVLPDVEGEYLPDRETALSVAKSSTQEVLLEAVKFRQVPPDDIQVTDAEGRVVITVSLDDVIKRD